MTHLPVNSISSWPELYKKFVCAFTGGVQPPKSVSDLRRVVQKDGESLQKFVQRFTQMQHIIPNAHKASIIATFHDNVNNPRMLEKMRTRSIKTITVLFELADKVTRVEEPILPVNRDAGKRSSPRGSSGT